MKTVHVDLTDRSSVQNAIKDLEALKKEWKRKANLCAETIAAMLADKITENITSIPYSDDLIDLGTQTALTRYPIAGAIATGNRVLIGGDEIAFIEFGAGIYHNAGTHNPLSEKVNFDTAIGSYGKGHGNEPYWFIAHNLISRGTPAYMPIYKAIEEIKPMIPTIVRQVFV